MRAFDIESAKSGVAVCTRDGRSAKIIAFDADVFDSNGTHNPVIALIKCSDEEERIYSYTEWGEFDANYQTDLDLMMTTVHHTGYVNVYKLKDGQFTFSDRPFPTAKDAARAIFGENCVDTIKVEWDE